MFKGGTWTLNFKILMISGGFLVNLYAAVPPYNKIKLFFLPIYSKLPLNKIKKEFYVLKFRMNWKKHGKTKYLLYQTFSTLIFILTFLQKFFALTHDW